MKNPTSLSSAMRIYKQAMSEDGNVRYVFEDYTFKVYSYVVQKYNNGRSWGIKTWYGHVYCRNTQKYVSGKCTPSRESALKWLRDQLIIYYQLMK